MVAYFNAHWPYLAGILGLWAAVATLANKTFWPKRPMPPAKRAEIILHAVLVDWPSALPSIDFKGLFGLPVGVPFVTLSLTRKPGENMDQVDKTVQVPPIKPPRQDDGGYATFAMLAALSLAGAIFVAVLLLGALSGCSADQKKTGLTVINAVMDARNLSIKTVRRVDAEKHDGFDKRYVGAKTEEEVAAIRSERSAEERQVRAAYDFLESFGRALETAKVALLGGASFSEVLPPVAAAAMAAADGLKDLGIASTFLQLLTGGM